MVGTETGRSGDTAGVECSNILKISRRLESGGLKLCQGSGQIPFRMGVIPARLSEGGTELVFMMLVIRQIRFIGG